MEILQVLSVNENQIVFEDYHDKQHVLVVAPEVADRFQKDLQESEEEGEPLIIERSSFEELRAAYG